MMMYEGGGGGMISIVHFNSDQHLYNIIFQNCRGELLSIHKIRIYSPVNSPG